MVIRSVVSVKPAFFRVPRENIIFNVCRLRNRQPPLLKSITSINTFGISMG